jgi:hypothetical protein
MQDQILSVGDGCKSPKGMVGRTLDGKHGQKPRWWHIKEREPEFIPKGHSSTQRHSY